LHVVLMNYVLWLWVDYDLLVYQSCVKLW